MKELKVGDKIPVFIRSTPVKARILEIHPTAYKVLISRGRGVQKTWIQKKEVNG